MEMAKAFGNGRDSQNVTFIRQFAELGFDHSKARAWLAADNGAWLSFLAENAVDSAYEAISSHGTSSVVYGDLDQLGKIHIYLSNVHVGDIRYANKITTVPITWVFVVKVREENLDIKLESDLELLSRDPELSSLSIMARYRIPTNEFEIRIYREVLSCLFQLTAKIFVDAVALDLRKLSAI